MSSHSGRSSRTRRSPSFFGRDEALLVALRVVEKKMDPYLGVSLLGVIANDFPDVALLDDFRAWGAEPYAPTAGPERAEELVAACRTLVRALHPKQT